MYRILVKLIITLRGVIIYLVTFAETFLNYSTVALSNGE